MDGAGYRLRRVAYFELDGWRDDDPRDLLPGLLNCADHIRSVKPYRPGSLGLTSADLVEAVDRLRSADLSSSGAFRAEIENQFVPFKIERQDGGRGFVTAFYEPEVAVSDHPDDSYRYPFYARPADLVDIDGDATSHGLSADYRFARLRGDVIEPYPDRRTIDQGYLDGQGLEIAWARSKVDVFFAHVQGAARLRFPDGRVSRITYAAKAGHPFTGIGKLLVEQGSIPAETVSMQTIRAWLAANPERVDEVLWHNRSYIFFKQVPGGDDACGPIAAAKVPLIAGRALAVDRTIHTFGFPFFIRSETITHMDEGRPFARLMLALDTGSAIVGAARGDIFTGSGDQAGEAAGGVRSAADFYLLIPTAAAGRYAAS